MATPTKLSASKLGINPPLINTACPWATTKEDLAKLYKCPYSGAVTIRTSLLKGFEHDDAVHEYAFFDCGEGSGTKNKVTGVVGGDDEKLKPETSSLNTLGYSPITFSKYLDILREFAGSGVLSRPHPQHSGSEADINSYPKTKPFIVSVTGTVEEVATCATSLAEILNQQDNEHEALRVLMEINLSCPNIVGKEPPAYDGERLQEYITAIGDTKKKSREEYGHKSELLVGIKTPPYTYHSQFVTLISSLENCCSSDGVCPINFITATNTLGSCLLLDSDLEPALRREVGGMAGDAIHALSLGNVKIIRGLLDQSKRVGVREVEIIGVGGVKDGDSWKRMRKAGAGVVGLATGLGREGIDIFKQILGCSKE